MKTYVFDTETNALFNYDKLHCAVFHCVETGEEHVFRNVHCDSEPLVSFLHKLQSFGKEGVALVCHNLIGYDRGVLRRFCDIDIVSIFSCLDTLVLSRLLNYNQEGGHSLDSWGKYFGIKKSGYDDFSQWSQELEDRCKIDVTINVKLYKYFLRFIEDKKWQPSIDLEHKTAILCEQLHENGVGFNVERARELHNELTQKVSDLLVSFSSVFPKRSMLVKEIHPVATKSGAIHSKDFRWMEERDLTAFSVDAPFSLFEWSEFNPNSPRQRVERLNAAGWRPYNKTKGHIKAERDRDFDKLKEYKVYGWAVDEENLATLPDDAPEAIKKLKEYILLASRLSSLTEWIGLYNETTGRIHPTFNPIGAWSHRKSHVHPNSANIPSLLDKQGRVQPYGAEFRELFYSTMKRKLIGCDAEGIQLRLFAHYCNDQKLITAISTGNKDEKTDIHSLNKAVLDTICNSRDTAKTYIYALLLGAGIKKQAAILNCSVSEAALGLERILEYYPGWKELKSTRLKDDAKRGFFFGLDGRKVLFPSAHHILAGYLQNGESVVMKRACLKWHEKLTKLGVPFLFVNDVHDEWQTEGLEEYAEVIGQTQSEAIYEVGVELGLNCPLAGKFKIGNNWKETH